MKIQKVVVSLLLTSAVTIGASFLHLANQKIHAETVSTYQSLPWGKLYEKQEPKKRQTGGSRSSLCPIAPSMLGNISEIWHQQPLFLWQGPIGRIEILRSKSDELIWSQVVKESDRSLVYIGSALQPGESYDWMSWDDSMSPIFRVTFQVLGGARRDRISSDLNRLEATLKQEGATKERIAYARAEYFASRQMWADALQEAYSVENPSENLTTFRQSIPERFCQ